MRHVAEVIGCTPADVEDVVSFYTMFYTRPVGTYVLQVCRTLSCALMGAERVTEELSRDARHQAGRDRRGGRVHAARSRVPRRVRSRAGRRCVNDDWHECQTPEDVRALVDGSARDGDGGASRDVI